jgi:hypothetical protein
MLVEPTTKTRLGAPLRLGPINGSARHCLVSGSWNSNRLRTKLMTPLMLLMLVVPRSTS